MSDQYVDRGRLGASVREWLAIVEEGGELTSIKVIHEGARDPIREYTRGRGELPKNGDGTEADDLIEAIAKKIEGDAAGFDGTVEQYYVEAYFGLAHRSSAREPFRVSIEEGGKENRRGRTEKPTAEGALALVMRLADAAHGRSLNSLEKLCTQLGRMVEQGLTREANMRDEMSKLRDAIDGLTSRAKDDERKDRQAVDDRAFRKELFADLKVLARIIANRAAGGQLIPDGELSPEQRLIRAAVKELDENKTDAMMALLQEHAPRLAQLFGEMVTTVMDEDARRAGLALAADRALKKKAEEAPAALPLNGHAVTRELGPARGEPLPR